MELKTLSPEAWRDALVSEDTEAFLSVARNYLGRIPTPYNKHVLVSRLDGFLRKPETAEAQAALLDSFDVQILGALALAGPTPELFFKELFSDGRSSWEVSSRLANLRDRLILFRVASPRGPVLAVTPHLAARLGREADSRALLGCVPAGGPLPAPYVDADTICAVACVLFHEENPLRKDNRPNKRVRERVMTLVPELAASTEAGDVLDALLAGFRGAGFLSPSSDAAGVLDMDRLSSAAEAWKDRLPFFVAAASAGLGFRPDDDSGPPEPYARLADRARFLETVASLLPERTAIGRAGVRRLALLAGQMAGVVGASQAEYAAEALLRFGLLRPADEGIVRAAPRRRAGGPSEDAAGPVLVVEASHAVQVLPEADPAARVFAGTVARLESRGEVWSCVLDRKSVRGALDAGFGAAEIARVFEELSGRPLPQSLAFSLAGWEKEYLSVRLYSGLVLAADGPARTMVENAPAMRDLLGERVAEGSWLLASGNSSEIRAALEKAGLHAPRVRRVPDGSSTRAVLPRAPAGRGAVPSWAAALTSPGADRPRRTQDVQERLRRTLEGMEVPEERKLELAERISRRLILSEDQLSRADTEGGRLEAGALDYLGKVRVVERVLRSGGALLEILFRRPDGEPERLRVRPLELEKTDKGLTLRASDPEGGGVRILAVSAMSHVKLIKTTLFGEDHEYDNQ